MINLITSTKIKLGNIWAKPFAFLAFALLLLSGKAISQAANLDQIRNGSATARISPADWVNGNAGPSNAHYAEGWSIPYRMIVTGVTPGSSHTLIIEFDTKQSGGHAIDFVTRYDFLDNPAGSHLATFGHVPETINPLLGLSGTFSAPSTAAFPPPGSTGSSRPNEPTTTFNSLAGNTYMTIYNGTITSMGYDFEQAPSNANAASTTRLRIVFTASASTAVFAWGGHIATQATWGVGQGATGVSGSPYHTRLISIDGSGGNQDRSLKASAVIIPKPPCSLSANQTACQGSVGPLTYSYTGLTAGITNYAWSLTSNTAGAKIDGTASGPAVTSVNVVPTDAVAGFTTGSFTLQLTTTNAGGTTNCTATGTITARPTRPTVTYKGPECNETTFSVTVVGAVTGGSYTLTQDAGGVSPVTKTTAANADASGNITFSGLTVGKGFSITLTVGDCTSDATDCSNYKTAITANSKTQVAQPLVQENSSGTKVIAAPNPFNDYIRFTITPAESGRGSLDLYNLLGQKVKTVYQGNVVKGQSQTIEYSVPNTQRSLLIYRFQVGTQSVTGKLLGLK